MIKRDDDHGDVAWGKGEGRRIFCRQTQILGVVVERVHAGVGISPMTSLQTLAFSPLSLNAYVFDYLKPLCVGKNNYKALYKLVVILEYATNSKRCDLLVRRHGPPCYGPGAAQRNFAMPCWIAGRCLATFMDFAGWLWLLWKVVWVPMRGASIGYSMKLMPLMIHTQLNIIVMFIVLCNNIHKQTIHTQLPWLHVFNYPQYIFSYCTPPSNKCSRSSFASPLTIF